MTVLQVFMALLLLAGLVYALMYVGWLPRPHGSASRAGSVTDVGNTAKSAKPPPSAAELSAPNHQGSDDVGFQSDRDDDGQDGAGSPPALTLAWSEGTYLSTTMAVSRQERVGAPGLDARARANMVVDDSSVRWEREGLAELRVAGRRLLGVSLRQSLTAMLLGQAKVVLVSWRAGNRSALNRGEKDDQQGELYVTGFLPRSRTDSAALVSAVQRLMKMDGTP